MLRRKNFSLGLSLLLLLIVFLISLTLGTVHIAPGRIFAILTQALGLSLQSDLKDWERIVLLQVRLPRSILALAVGAALALCGAAMQGMFRNPLACPSITGVSSGAALGAVFSIYLGIANRSTLALPACAFFGALCSILTVYSISSRRGQVSLSLLLLAGVAISSMNIAVMSFILSLALADYETGKQIVFWTLGGLGQSSWSQVHLAVPVILLGSAVVLYYSRELDALALGELHAVSVGVEVASVRNRLIVATTMLTAATVCVCGTIGFVGLIVPHAARFLIGSHHRRLFPACLILGGVLVLGADILARVLIAPEEIHLGVITAAAGAPFFMFLLVSQARGKSYV